VGVSAIGVPPEADENRPGSLSSSAFVAQIRPAAPDSASELEQGAHATPMMVDSQETATDPSLTGSSPALHGREGEEHRVGKRETSRKRRSDAGVKDPAPPAGPLSKNQDLLAARSAGGLFSCDRKVGDWRNGSNQREAFPRSTVFVGRERELMLMKRDDDHA
jgi:hypothetical protein